MNLPKARWYYLVVVPAIVFICTYFINGFQSHPPVASADMAAWVQAIGSIMAIAGAFLIGERQAETALKNSVAMSVLAEAKKRDAILAIAQAASTQVDAIADYSENKKSHKLALLLCYEQRIFLGIIDALSGIPIHEIGSAAGVAGLLGMKNDMIKIQTAIHKYLNTPIPASAVVYEIHEQPDPRNVLQIGGFKRSVKFHYDALKSAIAAN